MREQTIVVPGSYFIKKSDWMLSATGQNQPSAELIAVFLFHYDNRSANRILTELVTRAIGKHGKGLRDLGEWMPYSLAYMRECLLMTHGGQQVFDAVKRLEKLEFISTDAPIGIKEFYSRNHTWIKLRIDKIQNWIDTVWIPGQKHAEVYPTTHQDIKDAIENVTGVNVAESIESDELKKPKTPVKYSKQIDIICAFDKHIHGRNSNFVYDKERKRMIHWRLDEQRTLGECAQAIIGNTLSDFHQARHPENMLGQKNPVNGRTGTRYNDVSHIFKTTMKFEKMMEYAENAGVTVEIAENELALFLEGQASQYSAHVQKLIKNAQKPTDAPKSVIDEVPLDIRREYKGFAFSINRFFLTNVPNSDIMEMCETNIGLKNQSVNVFNAEVLEIYLIEATKMNTQNLTPEIKANIKQFAVDFCEMKDLNK